MLCLAEIRPSRRLLLLVVLLGELELVGEVLLYRHNCFSLISTALLVIIIIIILKKGALMRHT